MTGKEKSNEADKQGFLEFKKEQWEQQSSYNARKLGQKYDFKWANFHHERKKASLDVTRFDLDALMSKYKETDDVFLKDIYKEDIKDMRVMYRKHLKAFADNEVAPNTSVATPPNNSTAAPPNENSTEADS